MIDSPKTTGRQLARKVRAIGLTSGTLIGLLGLLGADDPDPKALIQIKKHLAQIGEEMLGYRGEGGNKTLPWAIRDKAGKPLLSWRVAILPRLGEVELYRKFKLDEPWDSPNNKPLVEKMPAIFAPFGPGTNPPGSTFFQVLVGPGTLFDGKTGFDLRSIPDGADSTLLVIEAAEAVPWSKPWDLTYDPKGPLPRFGGHFKDGSLALFADGSVAFIRANIDEPTLRALITRDGAETVARRTLRDHVVPVRRR
jgi:hypothetical protein